MALTIMPEVEETPSIIPRNFPELVRVKISDLSLSKLNPTVRSLPAKLKGLSKDLAKEGQLNPITIKKTSVNIFRVVNGHRRIACLTALGETWVDAIILNNKSDYDKTFTAMHANTMKINTVQECERWLKGAKHISAKTLGRIESLKTRLGAASAKNVIKRCVKTNKSPGTIATTMEAFEQYVGTEEVKERSFREKLAYWLLNIASAFHFHAARQSMIPAELLVECIENRTPIPEDWAINS